MKDWFLGLPREARWISGLVALFFCSLVLVVLVELLNLLTQSAAQVAEDKPTVARLLGYEAASDELKAAARVAIAEVRNIAYPSGVEDGEAGANLQQTLRGYAEDAGLTVSGSRLQILEDDDDDEAEVAAFKRLSVQLSLEGPPMALDAFLTSVGRHTPRLTAVSMDIQRRRQKRRDSKNPALFEYLTVRMAVVALKEPSP